MTAAVADMIRVPLSFNHLIEVCASGDMDRRKRLASFMVKLSRQYSILPFLLVRQEEILESVLRRLGINAQIFKRERLVQQGLWCAFGVQPTFEGGHPNQTALLEQVLHSDAMAIKMLSEWMSSEGGRSLRQQSEQEAMFLDKIRHAQLRDQGAEGKRREDTLAAAKLMLLPLADAECRKFGIAPAKLHATFGSEDDLMGFAHDVPSFDVLLELILARDEEAQRQIHRNDLRDMGFLATAIPYCDVVVVERYFGFLAKRLGLDQKYGCTILTNVAELPSFLPKPTPVPPTAAG